MKPATLFLTASLVANAALVAVYTTRPAAPATAVAVAKSPVAAADQKAKDDALRAALASGDATALRAAGVSAEVARELALGRALSRIADRTRASQNKGDGRWWRTRNSQAGSREQQLLARRELSDALTAAFGDDLGLGGGDPSQLAFLSPEKRDALRRITQDYDEMMAKFAGNGGVQLASDKEKLKLLRAERDRDIATLLTPEERLAYEMRTSPSGTLVRNRYGDAIEFAAEFEKIYALQRAFDEKFSREALSGRISPEVLRARSDAERQLDSDFRAAVGTDRYAALRRAADPDLRTIDLLVSRLNLPPETTDNLLAARNTFAAESQRINNDATAPIAQRRTQIQELATRAKAEVSRALGSEAADAYAPSSPWLNMLQGGMAYSTAPQSGSPGSLIGGGQSVFPVMPAGAAGPSGARQVIFNATSDVPAAGAFFQAVPVDGGNVRVMTFSTSSTETTSPAAPSSDQRTIIVAPPKE